MWVGTAELRQARRAAALRSAGGTVLSERFFELREQLVVAALGLCEQLTEKAIERILFSARERDLLDGQGRAHGPEIGDRSAHVTEREEHLGPSEQRARDPVVISCVLAEPQGFLGELE